MAMVINTLKYESLDSERCRGWRYVNYCKTTRLLQGVHTMKIFTMIGLFSVAILVALSSMGAAPDQCSRRQF